ncbi:MAG: YggT family protein [Gemmatimonadetes bacterium]|nr:YggT family protein [Gemmatimonadota bacterium]
MLRIAVEQIAALINLVAQLYFFVLIGHIICSWVRADPYQPIVRFIYMVTEPVLSRVRRFIPPIAGLDFSVLVVIVVLQIGVQGFLVRSLYNFARTLG